jgi:dimeric dUTPase (all-alpha-NTP-PPase superfamily)
VEEDYFHIRVRPDPNYRGFISLFRKATLKDARMEISKSPNYPRNFTFWFEKMQTPVQPYQEENIKAIEAAHGTTLIIESQDLPISFLENDAADISEEILSLWVSAGKDRKEEPLVSLLDLITALARVYGDPNLDPNSRNIINGGIGHFLGNINTPDNFFFFF